MSLVTQTYQQIRSQVRPGDIIAFGGKGNFSELIKWATRSTVSHVGIVLQSEIKGAPGISEGGYMNQIIESTTLNGKSGVIISRLSDRANTYDGELWWLSLAPQARARVDAKMEEFYQWCLNQENKPYDVPQSILSALDALDKLAGSASPTLNKEDFSAFFCSELAAGALEVTGALPPIIASEVTPIDLCSFSIFAKDYIQIRGKRKSIKSYNTIDPKGWAQSTGALHAA